MVEQLLKIENVTKINQFIEVFQNNVETDLSFQNILWFAQQAVFGGLSIDNVEFVTMPNRNTSLWSRTYHNYQSYVTPIADELLDLVNNKLSPYTRCSPSATWTSCPSTPMGPSAPPPVMWRTARRPVRR